MTLRVLMATSEEDVATMNKSAKTGKPPTMNFALPKHSALNDECVIFTHEGLYAYAKVLGKPEESTFRQRLAYRAPVGRIELIKPSIITNTEVEDAVDGWNWLKHPRRSFCTPADEHAKALLELVYKRLGKRVAPAKRSRPDVEDTATAKSSGAGYQSDQAKRDACENYAMGRAEKRYKEKGFTVENKSPTESYDLLCTKGKQVVHVEVKGTTTDGSEVELTKGEVESARVKGRRTDLFVVSNIKLKEINGEFTPSGGKERVFENWQPAQEDLIAIRFRYKVPVD